MVSMVYVIYLVKRENLDKVKTSFSDDILSRQSITVRDGLTLKNKKDGYIIFIEGSKEGIDIADKLIAIHGVKLGGDEAELLYKFFKEESQNVADGLGAIFGE